ncbi:heparan sulfate 2-O-sulfotransferase 1 [Nematostella vectensis]|uniref:heparan sulfate 2-O-sulfotransferase 1 n=1 Tax=Nematostella vectensis TaxID=45351 RepID=UPI001390285B|nr:heparan sulfate 2-O-sulfotransferase 1 [Nematostella vectensis]
MFGRSLGSKFPCIVVLIVFGIIEVQILDLTKSRTGLRKNFKPNSDESNLQNEDKRNILVVGDESNERPMLTKTAFGAQSVFDNTVIIYNRVPKTASTSFMGVVYDLSEQNNYHTIHLNVTKNSHVMSVTDQLRFAHNITQWSERLPAFYHGHVQYIEFQSLGVTKPVIYINVIRKPLDRLVSYYYFLRFGDTFRPHKRRSRQGNKETFDECLSRGHKDCQPEKLWLQVPFFCGHAPQCQSPGNKWALEQAKRHLVEKYLLVGLTEQLEDFITILETALPRFFKGATNRFQTGNKSHLRKTASKQPLQQQTLDFFYKNKIWKMENEFYEFARKVFNGVKKKTLIVNQDGSVTSSVEFFYEKIRPRSTT